MQEQHIPHPFIIIEGNIGAGKTTLSGMLSRDFKHRLILEEFSDNPFLPYFYENPERYAFPVELFFMTERHKQLQEELSQPQLFERGVISDYIFVKTLLFAKNNLKTEEFRLFQRLFNILNTNFRKPDILLYLHQPVKQLMDNIQKRGRSYEQQMDPNYLLSIQQAYFDYFKTTSDIPIVILEIQELDFVQHSEHYRAIVNLLCQSYPPGIHHIQGSDIINQ